MYAEACSIRLYEHAAMEPRNAGESGTCAIGTFAISS